MAKDPKRVPDDKIAKVKGQFLNELSDKIKEPVRKTGNRAGKIRAKNAVISCRATTHKVKQGDFVYIIGPRSMPGCYPAQSYNSARPFGIALEPSNFPGHVIRVQVAGIAPARVDDSDWPTQYHSWPVGPPIDEILTGSTGPDSVGTLKFKTGDRSCYLSGLDPIGPTGTTLYPVALEGDYPFCRDSEFTYVSLNNTASGFIHEWTATAVPWDRFGIDQGEDGEVYVEVCLGVDFDGYSEENEVTFSFPRAALRFDRGGNLLRVIKGETLEVTLPIGGTGNGGGGGGSTGPSEEPPEEEDPPYPPLEPPTGPGQTPPVDPPSPGVPPATSATGPPPPEEECPTPPDADEFYDCILITHEGCKWWNDDGIWRRLLDNVAYCVSSPSQDYNYNCAYGYAIDDTGDVCIHGAFFDILDCSEDCYDPFYYCYENTGGTGACYLEKDAPTGWTKRSDQWYETEEECEENCPDEVEPECPSDCSSCPEYLHTTGFNSWCDCSSGGYEWQYDGGCDWPHVTVCGICVITSSVFCETLDSDQPPFEAGDDVWSFTAFHVTDGEATYMKEASDCPAGTYTKVSGAAGAPNSVTLSTGEL